MTNWLPVSAVCTQPTIYIHLAFYADNATTRFPSLEWSR